MSGISINVFFNDLRQTFILTAMNIKKQDIDCHCTTL